MKSSQKVLIISHNSFSKVSNNGKTLEAIFSSYESDNISQLFFSNNEEPDFSYCKNYFKITDWDILRSLMTFSKECGKEVVCKGDAYTQTSKTALKLKKRTISFLKFLHSNLLFPRDLLWRTNRWKSAKLISWCLKNKPDVIFFVGGDFSFSHWISQYLSLELKIPLVTYFTDDYIIYSQKNTIREKIRAKFLLNTYRESIRLSSMLFVIGEEMAHEYSIFFNTKFYYIMNSVEKIPYLPSKSVTGKRLECNYFGGLHLGRWRMISRLAKLCKDIEINVYSAQSVSKDVVNNLKKHGVVYKGKVVGNELIKKMQEADILLHIESDDPLHSSLTRLSISTKVPEYLMAGRVVLAFGPIHLASLKLLSNHQIGYAVSSELPDLQIKKKLEALCFNSDLRAEIEKRGYEYAVLNFDIKNNSLNFKKQLASLINNGSVR